MGPVPPPCYISLHSGVYFFQVIPIEFLSSSSWNTHLSFKVELFEDGSSLASQRVSPASHTELHTNLGFKELLLDGRGDEGMGS